MLNCPSYLIDNIIGSIHSSIAYTPDVELPSQLNGSLGSINNYWGAVVELSKLNRLQRRVIGEKFLEKAKKANSTGCSYGLAILDKENAVFILSSDKDRQKRVIELYNLVAMAYCGRGLRKILGIATEPLSVNYRSCDTVLLDNIKFENHKELVKKYKTYFGEPQNYHVSEYKDT